MTRILVVDDDPQFRAMLAQMLDREGYQTHDASSGEEALRLQRAGPYDLVIIDLLMPGKEGVEVLLELKADFPDVKVLAITGGGRLGPAEHLRTALEMGADRVLAKPFMRAELLEALRELLPVRPSSKLPAVDDSIDQGP